MSCNIKKKDKIYGIERIEIYRTLVEVFYLLGKDSDCDYGLLWL